MVTAELGQVGRLALALAIGFLIGVERGWRERDVAEGGRTAGIRTYSLSGMLGGVAALLGQSLGGGAFATIILPFAAAFIWFKQREQADEQDYSVTAVVAALLAFSLGAFAVVGDWRLASGAAVVVTGLLAAKGALHGWLKQLTWPELRSALVLLAMSFVVLPVLPDRGIGPLGLVNPFELWLLTIVLAGVSFLSYALVKVFGPSRGLVAASLAGALVSSTAVTLSLGRLAKGNPEQTRMTVGSALLASAVMGIRMGGVTAVLAPVVSLQMAAPLVAFALVSALAGAAMVGHHGRSAVESTLQVKSPFELQLVIKLALVLGAVMAAARALSSHYGASSVLPVSALAGLVDVDAVVLAISRMSAQDGLDTTLAARAILLAGVVDSFAKAGLAFMVGGRGFGTRYAVGTFIALAVALAVLMLTI